MYAMFFLNGWINENLLKIDPVAFEKYKKEIEEQALKKAQETRPDSKRAEFHRCDSKNERV